MFKILDDGSNSLDNLSVQISKVEPQTFDTADENGKLLKVTLDILKPLPTTTLGDLKKNLSNKEEALAKAATALQALQEDYDDSVALIEQIQKEADKLPARKPAEDIYTDLQ